MFLRFAGALAKAVSRYMNGKVSPKQAAFYKLWLKDLLLNRGLHVGVGG